MKPTINDVADYGNLVMAHANAKRGKQRYKSVSEFEEHKTESLHKLQEILLAGTFHTSKYINKTMCDSGKMRLISKLPYYPDRIVQWAIMLQLEPEFLRAFSKRSHAAIPSRGVHSALYQTRRALITDPIGTKYCLKLDIQKYFQHIDHEILKEKARNLTDDDQFISLIYENIDSFETGVPIGNYTSQYYANYYLSEFDQWISSKNLIHVRYMDDIVIFGPTAAYLHKIFELVKEYLETELRVSIKPNWQVFPVAVRGVDFVGYRIYPNRVLLRKRVFKKMRRKLSAVQRKATDGVFGTHEKSVVASYAGWIRYCTPAVRSQLYKKYIEPISLLLPQESEFNVKIKEMLL